MTSPDAAFAFRCACCGKVINGIPDFGFKSPVYWSDEAEGANENNSLTADSCVIEDCGFFVRGVLEIPVIGAGQRFGLGVWSTLSEPNFHRYKETFSQDQKILGPMSGYLSNRIPGYEETDILPVAVLPQYGGQRPKIWVADASREHPLFNDQRNGITKERLGELFAAFSGGRH